MEKQKMDITHSKREHRYDEIRELIGQLTLIENHIRLRQCNGALYRDEISLRILLDQHRDALYELGMRLRDLKKLDREDEDDCAEDDEDDCIEDEECSGCVDCDMRDEDDEVRIAKNRRAEDDDVCDNDSEVGEDVATDFVCNQIHDIDILRELYRAWLNYCDVCSCENVLFLHCGQFYITMERDIDNLISEHIFVPHCIFENHQDEYVHYACFNQDNFHKLTQRIDDLDNIDYNIIRLDNNTIATRLNYD